MLPYSTLKLWTSSPGKDASDDVLRFAKGYHFSAKVLLLSHPERLSMFWFDKTFHRTVTQTVELKKTPLPGIEPGSPA
jgi:hypothetical protein